MKLKIWIVTSLIVFAFGWNFNNPYEPEIANTAQQEWFSQIIDHFNYNSDATFQQRYYVLSDYYKPGGPAFLYIAG